MIPNIKRNHLASILGIMAEKDDYSKRAAEFLKLWQENVTRQMNDPETIRAMLAV
jgi:hypothetical protein